jgi:uncharacterized protein YacL
MLLWLIRGFFAALLLAVSVFTFTFVYGEFRSAIGGGLAVLALVGLGGLVLWTDIREKNKQIANVSSIYFGLLFGLVIGWLFSLAGDAIVQSMRASLSSEPGEAQRLADRLSAILRMLITLISCYVSVSLLVQTRDDFRFLIPYVEFSKQIKGGRPLVLDTSVIIDGRIADLCDTRLIDTRIIVPRFILQELQGIADSSDKLKRNRGRRGLDILKKLQTNTRLDLLIHEGNAGELKPGEKMRVDERLVAFAKVVGGHVVTNDFNLNKMAQLQGVEVINLNEVANSLKTVALPGEYLMLKVLKPGDQFGQGVGYLDDGTMVVVEQGKNLIGQEVSIVVTSVLQTPAGRMIFGRPEQRLSGSFVPVGQSGTQQPVKPDDKPAGGSGPSQPVKPTDPPNPPKG